MSNRLQLIDYDGINIFYKGKWTTLDYPTVEEARKVIENFGPLCDEKVEEAIRKLVFERNLTDTNNSAWNILKEAQDD